MIIIKMIIILRMIGNKVLQLFTLFFIVFIYLSKLKLTNIFLILLFLHKLVRIFEKLKLIIHDFFKHFLISTILMLV